ncbi:hypothetical protein BCR34DRAFT_593526 [Clohesyomyces aquaticus]|uniref:Uncharacterized protein n=1 Tax=Clohesyomyces aquaticus TaxID=1231657 RepID=A0A1Y1YI06_9PLEO|nr:hypothetical protein BCR34DRAFT_593526 [Clohesyomyces aquaticus]
MAVTMKGLLFIIPFVFCPSVLCGVAGLPRERKSLVKRVGGPTPRFQNFNEQNPASQARLQAIQNAFPDVKELAQQAIHNLVPYADVYRQYLPSQAPDWPQRAAGIYHEIIDFKSPLMIPPRDIEFGHKIVGITFTDEDFLLQEGEDHCGAGAEAYTKNVPKEEPNGPVVLIHICRDFLDAVASGQDLTERTFDQINVNGLRFGLGMDPPGSYTLKVTEDMAALATTIFHEFMHANIFSDVLFSGSPIPPAQQGPGGANIVDHQNLGVGRDGYGPYQARMLNRQHPELAKTHAEAYVWIAMEIVWTERLKSRLGIPAFQNGRLLPPNPLQDESSSSDSQMSQ